MELLERNRRDFSYERLDKTIHTEIPNWPDARSTRTPAQFHKMNKWDVYESLRLSFSYMPIIFSRPSWCFGKRFVRVYYTFVEADGCYCLCGWWWSGEGGSALAAGRGCPAPHLAAAESMKTFVENALARAGILVRATETLRISEIIARFSFVRSSRTLYAYII